MDYYKVETFLWKAVFALMIVGMVCAIGGVVILFGMAGFTMLKSGNYLGGVGMIASAIFILFLLIICLPLTPIVISDIGNFRMPRVRTFGPGIPIKGPADGPPCATCGTKTVVAVGICSTLYWCKKCKKNPTLAAMEPSTENAHRI